LGQGLYPVLGAHLGQPILFAPAAAHTDTTHAPAHKVDRQEFPVSHVATEDDRARGLLEGFRDALVTFSGFDDLIDPSARIRP
jgi:hypothetical protein